MELSPLSESPPTPQTSPTPLNPIQPPYTEILGEQISIFFTTWDVDEKYTLADVATKYSIDIRLARYYLMRGVRRGQLCRVKYGKHTYYMLPCWIEYFRYIGLRVM